MDTRKIMKYAALFSAFYCFVAAPSHAQDSTYAQTCKAAPESKNNIDKAMRDKVLATIDLTQYDNPSVTVKSKVVSINQQPLTLTSSELLENLTVAPGSFPPGLAFGVTGSVSVDLGAICEYIMRVEVKIRGTSKATGERLDIITQSQITVTTPVSRALQKIS